MKEVKIKNRNFRIYIDSNTIQKRVSEIAAELDVKYKNKNPVFLIVLKGSIFFATDLLKYINFDCNIQMISAKSYGSEMESSGKVEIEKINLDIKNRDILIIEDIVDSGITINSIAASLKKLMPSDIKVVSLLDKPANRIVKADVDYKGFEIDNQFVVGYGLDYAEYGRNLKDIYILDE